MPHTANIVRSFVWGTLAALAALLVAVPSAFASPAQYGPHDTWYPYAISLTQERVLDAHHHALILNARAQAARQQPFSTFTTDTLAPGGRGAQPPVVVHFTTDTLAPGGGDTTTVVTTGDGFDWGDAGIGAAIAIGGVLLASAAAVSVRRRGRLAF